MLARPLRAVCRLSSPTVASALPSAVCVSRRSLSSATTQELPIAKPVVLDWNDLQSDATSKTMMESISTAFGPSGIGLLLVKGVPGYPEARQRLLPLGTRFAQLPEQVRLQYEHTASKYGVGWSHGKEMFKGVPDLLKASYKANPQYNVPTNDKSMMEKFPQYSYPNIWPRELPELEQAFMSLGQLMVNVGLRVALHCDAYVASKLPVYKPRTLHNIIKESRTTKARLLNYFPQSTSTAEREWCGWHNDHGALTALTTAMYINEDGKQVPSPDTRAGLAVAPRHSQQQLKVNIPVDHIAYQIGECAQILSGGLLKATPHMVRGPAVSRSSNGVHRSTFAVFMQPQVYTNLNLPAHDTINAATALEANPWVPPLAGRYKTGYDFNDFTQKTFAAYYSRDGAADN